MVIKNYRWIGLECGDTLFRIPSVCKTMAMTLMYECSTIHMLRALS
ncbi:MAG: hypothetical protein ACFFG0_22115 [Candidatus Thorarchaeota archaeon]